MIKKKKSTRIHGKLRFPNKILNPQDNLNNNKYDDNMMWENESERWLILITSWKGRIISDDLHYLRGAHSSFQIR